MFVKRTKHSIGKGCREGGQTMKKKRLCSILLLFAVIILHVPVLGETMPDAEGASIHVLSLGELSVMLYEQDDAGLAGETISVTGFFGGVFKEGTEDVYGLMYLASVDACCAESIRFIPAASCTEFPDRNTLITVTGTLTPVETNGFTALRICDAELVLKPAD